MLLATHPEACSLGHQVTPAFSLRVDVPLAWREDDLAMRRAQPQVSKVGPRAAFVAQLPASKKTSTSNGQNVQCCKLSTLKTKVAEVS